MCIARHWGTDDPAQEDKRVYNEAERERIWERTLLTKRWKEMVEKAKTQ